MLISSLDTSKLSSLEAAAGGRRLDIVTEEGYTTDSFLYDVTDRALVQIWIYEREFDESGNYIGEKLQKIIAHENYMPTNQDLLDVTEKQTSNEFFNKYVISTTDIAGSIKKAGTSLDIRFVYAKVNSVYVEYYDEDGNAVINPKRVVIEEDDTATVPVPDLSDTQKREFRDYTIEDIPERPIYEDPTREGYDEKDPDDKKDDVIELTGLPERNLIMIVIYRRNGTPELPPEDEIEGEDPPFAFIKSNERLERTDGEYLVEDSIPTEEDLYANIVTEEYMLREYFREVETSQKFKVQLIKEYYEQNDEDGDGVAETSTIERANVGNEFEYIFDYKYYGGLFTNLYILQSGEIFNEAVIQDGVEGSVNLEAKWIDDKKPYLEYVRGGELTIPTGDDGTDGASNSRVLEVSQAADGTIFLKILIMGTAYSYDDIDQEAEVSKYKNGTLDQLLVNISSVNGDNLEVISSHGEITTFLHQYNGDTGNEEDMIWVPLRSIYNDDSIVNDLITYGYYDPNQKAAYCWDDCLYSNKDIFIREDAQNEYYISTDMNIGYSLYQIINSGDNTVEEYTGTPEIETKHFEDASTQDPYNSNKIFYETDDPENFIKKNNIYVYTPIVNRIQLYENPEDTTVINNYNQVIGIDNVINTINTATGNEVRILNVDEEFLLTIPHDGYHPGSGDETVPSRGYGDKKHNYTGLASGDIADHATEGWVRPETFAKEKLVKFSFDVYLARYSGDDGDYIIHRLLEANTWHKLSEITGKNGSDTMNGLKAENYIFVIPTWVKDNESGDVSVRIVATNFTGTGYDQDTVYGADGSELTLTAGTEITPTDTSAPVTKYNLPEQYILEQKYSVYIAGSIYDLQVRTTDDVGYEERLTKALTLARLNQSGATDPQNRFLPIGQRKQIPTYNTGIKLGYSVYFDLKTKGTASNEILITPKIYYVSNDGATVTDDISLFYRPVEDKAQYEKIDNTFLETMIMTNTKGDVNNSIFRNELARAIKMIELYNDKNDPDIKNDFSDEVSIATLFEKLILSSGDNRLPYDNLNESYNKYGYSDEATFINELQEHIDMHSATLDANLKAALETYFSVDGYKNDNELQTLIRSFNGHWYGEFSFPQTTKVVLGNVTEDDFREKDALLDGYLVVVFDEIKTTTTPGVIGGEYLSYDMPSGESQWEKEAGGVYNTITLPNGNSATIPNATRSVTKPDGTPGNTMSASAMAIYEVGKTRAEDQNTGGTH